MVPNEETISHSGVRLLYTENTYIYIFKKLCLAVNEPIAYVFLRHPHYSPLKKREQNKI